MPEVVQAACFRLGLEAFVDEAAMARALIARLRPLAADGVQLAVLPGMYGACLLAPWLSPVSWAELIRTEGRGLREAFIQAGVRAASACGMVLVPGSVPVWTGNGYGELAVVVGPEGLYGEAYATQPDPQAPDRSLGDRLDPVDTPVGRLGLLVGVDVGVPEVSRILALKGADVLVAPLAPPAPYTSEMALAGLWQEVQQNQVFGLESGLSGDLAGRLRAGKAALLAPCEVSAEESGFLGRPGYLVREGFLASVLDFRQLAEVRERYPLRRELNPALYRNHAPPPPTGQGVGGLRSGATG